MAWTEIGLSPDDYPKIAAQLHDYACWQEIDQIILDDVLGSFALDSTLMLVAMVTIIGIFLITPFPDWGYDPDVLERRMQQWYRLPRWKHYLNPLRLIGYPIAYLMSLSLRRRLKAAYDQSSGFLG